MMAGMAISPLLKMKGENAMAIAWAAFNLYDDGAADGRSGASEPGKQGAA